MFERYKRQLVRGRFFSRYIIITDMIDFCKWQTIVFKADRKGRCRKVMQEKVGCLPAQIHEEMKKKWGKKYV